MGVTIQICIIQISKSSKSTCGTAQALDLDVRFSVVSVSKTIVRHDMFYFFRAQLTKDGHILGEASSRNMSALPERKLSAVSCAVLRCLTHLFMYTSSLINDEQVCLWHTYLYKYDVSYMVNRYIHHVNIRPDRLQRGICKVNSV